MAEYLNPDDIIVFLKCKECSHTVMTKLSRLMISMRFCSKCNYVKDLMEIDKIRYEPGDKENES